MAKVERHFVDNSNWCGSISWEEPTDIRVYREKLENSMYPQWEKVKRFNRMNAWVVRDTVNGNICLQSYRTIVAMKVGGEALSFGRWSVSTSRHQRDFAKWCRENPDFV